LAIAGIEFDVIRVHTHIDTCFECLFAKILAPLPGRYIRVDRTAERVDAERWFSLIESSYNNRSDIAFIEPALPYQFESGVDDLSAVERGVHAVYLR
jgi:hypothetical protein